MNIMDYRYEVNLYHYIKRYFKNKSFKSYEEFHFYERRIDILAYSPKKGEIISVEAKLTNWNKAFHQALLYQLCSDFVYVAMPKKKFKCIDQENFRKKGIGFLAIYESGRCQELIQPSQYKGLRSYYRDEIIESIEKPIL